jgi:hypothetical protein
MSEEQMALHPKRFQDWYHKEMNIAKKLRDYHQGLIDQYAEYGYAVDESETEVTDDEDEDDDNKLKAAIKGLGSVTCKESACVSAQDPPPALSQIAD